VILTPSGLLEHSRTESGRRMIRYGATSGIGVVGTQIMLLGFRLGLGWDAVPANLAATMLMSIPAFLLNKYWVWGKSGRAHLRREVIPFWIFTVTGWGLSTLAVWYVDNNVGEKGTLLHDLAVQAANIVGFGVLWVLKYLFLDKIMFGPHHHTPYDEDFEAEEAMLEARGVGATEV
jgi:putative flippase GtrA